MTPSFWSDRKVLITGHTGFKGGWLSLCLHNLGAKVAGIALAPSTQPNLYDLLDLSKVVQSKMADINDVGALNGLMNSFEPDVVFHLAAQSLVRPSYADPIETYLTNVVGTVSLLDSIRKTETVAAVIVVTSDKCYENREWHWGYRESDAMGGHDPYSSSKGCAEIATQSMRRAYFSGSSVEEHSAGIATARSGNVIGGGDWSEDRLVPDIIRECLVGDGSVALRNPSSVRPWQHVLEPVRGYLDLAEAICEHRRGFDEAWNFGPKTQDDRSVGEAAAAIVEGLGSGKIECPKQEQDLHEARLLRLDCSKARERLDWSPALDFNDAIEMTVDWYRAWVEGKDMRAVTQRQISDYWQIVGSKS